MMRLRQRRAPRSVTKLKGKRYVIRHSWQIVELANSDGNEKVLGEYLSEGQANQALQKVLVTLAGAVDGEVVNFPETPGLIGDQAAISLGRRGGLKGGPLRAEKLGKEKVVEIAKKAAKARWDKYRAAQVSIEAMP
jgi:hypothetical protein